MDVVAPPRRFSVKLNSATGFVMPAKPKKTWMKHFDDVRFTLSVSSLRLSHHALRLSHHALRFISLVSRSAFVHRRLCKNGA
eukprot:COSAG02_NODE_2080_length_9901_cov_103.580086_9_plen_82_part_00